MYQEIGKGIIT